MAKKTNKRKETPQLVVGSKVKEYIKGQGLRTSGETVDELSASVAVMLDAAVQRCQANNRSTVRGSDL